jgi:hypothetical protein
MGSSSTLLLFQPLLRSPLCLFAVFFAVSFLLNMEFKPEKLEGISWDCYHFWIVSFFSFSSQKLWTWVISADVADSWNLWVYFQLLYDWITEWCDVSEIFCSEWSSSKLLLPCFMFLTFCLVQLFVMRCFRSAWSHCVLYNLAKRNSKEKIAKHKKKFRVKQTVIT